MSAESDERLLLVDDDRFLLRKLTQTLEAMGYSVEPAQSPIEALEKLAKGKYRLVITDLSMPGTEDLSIYSAIREVDPAIPVIILTGYASPGQAASAMKMGCTDYLRKPVDPEELAFRIEKARHQSVMEAEVMSLRAQLKRSEAGRAIVGDSPAIRLVLEKIATVADSSATVLIRGETGTGKELVAKAIHNSSSRAQSPFVTVSCAAIPQTLLEGQLFGHKRGAYTGADRDQLGLLEIAERGTLFLDEIGELDMPSQVKLLRFLESGEVRPLGGREVRLLNVRLIAASNLDMEGAIEGNLLRKDLFYRLNVFPIVLPPLRERKEDIPLLVKHFVELHSLKLSDERKTFSPEAIKKLFGYDWPGNVRELENKVRQAILLTRADVVEASVIELPGDERTGHPRSFAEIKQEAVNKAEKQFIEEMLSRTNGVITQAARLAGLHRKNFSALMKKHGLSAQAFRVRKKARDSGRRLIK